MVPNAPSVTVCQVQTLVRSPEHWPPTTLRQIALSNTVRVVPSAGIPTSGNAALQTVSSRCVAEGLFRRHSSGPPQPGVLIRCQPKINGTLTLAERQVEHLPVLGITCGLSAAGKLPDLALM